MGWKLYMSEDDNCADTPFSYKKLQLPEGRQKKNQKVGSL